MTRWRSPLAQSSLRKLRELFFLLFSLVTLLFFLLRVAGDPALVLAGPDATEAQLAAIKAHYGLDQPLVVQYFNYLWSLARLDFGISLESGRPALTVVLEALPVTLQLTVMAMLLTIAICLPLGAWLGIYQMRGSRRVANLIVFLAQGVPGFVAGLFLIQLLSVKLGWLPSIGRGGLETWVLPTLTLASFWYPSSRVSSARRYPRHWARTIFERHSPTAHRRARCFGGTHCPTHCWAPLRSSVLSSPIWCRDR